MKKDDVTHLFPLADMVNSVDTLNDLSPAQIDEFFVQYVHYLVMNNVLSPLNNEGYAFDFHYATLRLTGEESRMLHSLPSPVADTLLHRKEKDEGRLEIVRVLCWLLVKNGVLTAPPSKIKHHNSSIVQNFTLTMVFALSFIAPAMATGVHPLLAVGAYFTAPSVVAVTTGLKARKKQRVNKSPYKGTDVSFKIDPEFIYERLVNMPEPEEVDNG